jgi:hypothetical protein
MLLGQNRRQVTQAFIANRNARTGKQVLYVILGSTAESARQICFICHLLISLT